MQSQLLRDSTRCLKICPNSYGAVNCCNALVKLLGTADQDRYADGNKAVAHNRISIAHTVWWI